MKTSAQLACSAACLFLSSITAANEPPDTYQAVVRYGQKAVAGAEVQWLGFDAEEPHPRPVVVLATTTANELGESRFTPAPGQSPHAVLAGDDRGRVGWTDLLGGVEIFQRRRPKIVYLFDQRAAVGTVLDDAGSPIAGAVVTPLHWNPPPSPRVLTARALEVPLNAAAALRTTTGADGRFRMNGAPLGGGVTVEIATTDHGVITVELEAEKVREVRLARKGQIEFAFDGPDDPRELAGTEAMVNRIRAGEDDVWCRRSARVGDDGTLVVGDLAPGDYYLEFRIAAHTGWTPLRAGPIAVSPDSTAAATISLQRAARVQGRLLDESDGKGIAHHKLTVYSSNGRQVLGSATTMTDDEGRFSVLTVAGEIMLSGAPPVGYLEPLDHLLSSTKLTVAPGETVVFPDYYYLRDVPYAAAVVDESGNPVAGMYIDDTSASHGGSRNAHQILTDAQGKFVLRGVDESAPTEIRGRTLDGLIFGPVLLEGRLQSEPARLVATRNGGSLRGRVVNELGEPIAEAVITVQWETQGVGRHSKFGLDSPLESHVTQADGLWECRGLWPADSYRIHVWAPEAVAVDSDRVKLEAGQTHNFGDLELQQLGPLEGTVVDSRGQPLAGVEVFNRGDSATPPECITSADGRFRLEGLKFGDVYAFGRKDGFRFGHAKGKTGSTDLRLTFSRRDEPPLPPADDVNGRLAEAERRLARRLVERLWRLPPPQRRGYEASLLECMAKLDGAQARAWFDKARTSRPGGIAIGDPLDLVIREMDVRAAAANDADEALALVEPLPLGAARDMLFRLADEFSLADVGSENRRRALRFTEEALVRARQSDAPDRALALAHASELLAKLGDEDVGRRMLDEALALARDLGTERLHGIARAEVARRFALVNFEISRELLAPIDSLHQKNRWMCDAVLEFAAVDPDRALAIVDQLEDDRSSLRDEVRGEIALRTAKSNLDAALDLCRAIRLGPYRVVAKARLAASRAAPDRAKRIIDECLEEVERHPGDFFGWTGSGGASTTMANIAYFAHRAGVFDPGEHVARLLASRPGLNRWEEAGRAPARVYAALVLSLFDRSTARELVREVMPPGSSIVRQDLRRDGLFAMALCDPESAAPQIDRLIDAIADGRVPLAQSGLIELADTLAVQGDERKRQLNSWTRVFFFE